MLRCVVGISVWALLLASACDEDDTLTPKQCEREGGTVVGDPGDGSVHDPEYRCEKSGEPPIGTIVTEDGEPFGIEGAVCCK